MASSKKVTMHDVAERAGVSYQTVSRVINDHPNVAAETRQRILRIIDEMNYLPSKVARSLATRQSQTLAVITYGMNHYGPTQMVSNIEHAAKSSGYDLIFSNIDHTDDEEELAITMGNLERRSIDGLILIAPVSSIDYRHIVRQSKQLPIVQIDTEPGSDVPSVIIDQHQGSYEITKHLLRLGHDKLAEISGPLDWYGAVARHEGFLQALDDAGQDAVITIEGDWTPISGYRCANTLIDHYDFTALVVGNDQMALGAMRALHERNLHIPDDISIVGFDDIPEASFFSPPLTTVRQEFSQLGKIGVEFLISMIENGISGHQKSISPELIIRQSTTFPPGH